MTKTKIMKKLFLGSLFVALGAVSYAQTVSFTLTTPPCNHNGVLTSTFTGLTPPLTVTYYTEGTSGTTIVHTGVSGLTDALTSYSGGPVYVTASDGFGGYAGGYDTGGAPFTYYFSAAPAPCGGLGSDTVFVIGGTAPYTYQWFNLSTLTTVGTTNPISLPPGAYGVTITDASGCVYGSRDENDSTKGGGIYSIPTFTLTATSTTANCTNGTASVSVSSGAIFPLSYAWSNGATPPSIIGLVMGYYSINVIDAAGCSASAYTYVAQAITITAPVVPTPATCIAHDGAVIAFGSGGIPPYSYIWSNGATTQSQTGLAGGYYGVAVTDVNGCIGTDGGYVGTSTPITATYSTTPTLCTSPTGSATLSLAGGTPPYSTMWYTTPPQTGITAVTLAQGNYAFNVTDAMGCVQSGTVTVPPIDIISASFMSTAPICTLSTGSMTVTPTGGVAPYSFVWSNGATTSTMTSVPTGLYHVTITDNMGCTAKLSEYLPYNSTLGVGLLNTPASCLFVSDGTLTAVASGGTTPYHYAWTGGGSTSIITSLPAWVPFWVTVTDALGCWVTDSATVLADTASSCYCTISGTVYYDINGNCIQDPGEPGIQNIQIHISGRGYTYTDTGGHYSYKVPSGSYTVSETVRAFYPLSACQPNNISVTSVAGTGCILPVDFANSMDTIHDMHICTWDYGQPVPGHTYYQVSVIKNNGTIPESTILTGYKPDGQFFAPLTFVPAGYFHGSPYWYNTADSFPVLQPGNSKAFLMTYNVPTNIPLGTNVIFKDTVTVDTPMTNWLVDYSPWDNLRYFNTTVVASFDPNFKEVYPKGTGSIGLITYADSILEYMVHFQNTGTFQAENIVVIDTLDDNLDWTTLSPVYMSAQCQVTVDQKATKKVATFTFNNINLPPSNSQPVTSNGLLSYSIKTRSGLPLGTQFKNSASIYFDYNAPVKTNQTLNTLGSSPVNVNSTTTSAVNNSFTIYPNPATSTFNAIINSDVAGSANLNITDVSGKTMINKTIFILKGAQTLKIDVSQLAPGVYLVNFNQNGKMQTQKLVVVKS